MRPPFLALAQLLCLASVGAVLRPSLATNPARLLGQVAELVLRSRLRTCDSCRVDVGVDPASIMCVYTFLSLFSSPCLLLLSPQPNIASLLTAARSTHTPLAGAAASAACE